MSELIVIWGVILPMIGYTGRLCPKGVPFQASGIKKGIEKLKFYGILKSQ